MSGFDLKSITRAAAGLKLDPEFLDKVRFSVEQSGKMMDALRAYMAAYDARKVFSAGWISQGERADEDHPNWSELRRLSEAEAWSLEQLRMVARPLVEMKA